MPPKKYSWGDIPNLNQIKDKDKDKDGKWIHCKMCDVRIKVQCQFSFTEWQMHTDGVKHIELSNSTALKDVPKLTKFFSKKRVNKVSLPKRASPPKNVRKLLLILDFIMEITLNFYL